MANLIAEMFDLEKVKQIIEDCPQDEVVILCGNWSVNKPNGYDDFEDYDWDWSEFEDMIGHSMMVNDYDDLIVDPHGIMNS